jgi:hypothetical protein
MSATTGSPEIHELLGRAAWARRLARRLVRQEDEADDLLQDAWLVAAARAPRGATGAWLKGVLRVLGMRQARASGRRRQRESESVTDAATAALDGAAPPDDLVDQVETQRRLSEALLALDEPYRTLIAESTLNAATVERCILRAMSDLRFPSADGGGAVRVRRLFTFPADASSDRRSERDVPTQANGERP